MTMLSVPLPIARSSLAGERESESTIIAAPAVQRGKIVKRRLAGDPGQRYYLYVPHRTEARPDTLFVSVHGISRNAREHAKRFAPLAERYGVALVAPRFARDRFPDYQRLGREGKGAKADQALGRIIDEVRTLIGIHAPRLHLFGFSGGGQFAHRYAMAYPEQVERVVVGAAGWYTFPDAAVTYPRGIKTSRSLRQVRFQREAFLRIPACVLVGSHDNLRDAALNTSRRVDRQQGETRGQRGRNWIEAMRREARALGLDTRYRYDELPGVGHDFTEAMKIGRIGEHTFQFLFGDPPPQQTLQPSLLAPWSPFGEHGAAGEPIQPDDFAKALQIPRCSNLPETEIGRPRPAVGHTLTELRHLDVSEIGR
jgi:pimeloyl-ACP methyl ester carboxylesterase